MIHYDDSERECPMCGARKPILPISTNRPDTQPAEPAAEKQSRRSAAPAQSVGRPAHAAGHPARSSTERKKRTPVLAIIIIMFVLLQLLPLIFGGLGFVLNAVRESLPEAGIPEILSPDEPIDFPHHSVWQIENGPELTLSRTPDEYDSLRYAVTLSDGAETGYYTAYPCTSADDWYFPEAYPEEDYSWWMVQLSPEDWAFTGDAPPAYSDSEGYGAYGGAVSIFQSRENPEELYFVSAFDEIPWLASNIAHPAARAGDADTADALIAQQMNPDAL